MTLQETVVFLVVVVVFTVVNGYFRIRDMAINSIGELKYRLRCSKENLELMNDAKEKTEYAKQWQKQLEEEVQMLEEKLENHWGKKILRKDVSSSWDTLPTHR